MASFLKIMANRWEAIKKSINNKMIDGLLALIYIFPFICLGFRWIDGFVIGCCFLWSFAFVCKWLFECDNKEVK